MVIKSGSSAPYGYSVVSNPEPVEEEAAVYAGYHRIYQNLYRSLKDGFKDLAGMKG